MSGPTTARFLSPLRVQFLAEWDGWRQRVMLVAPLRFYSARLDRTLEVPTGFVCDRESRPTAGPVTGPEMNPAGVLHDYLYGSHELPRRDADDVYLEALLSMGLDPVWASQRYRGVDQLGEDSYESGPRRFRVLNAEALAAMPLPYGAAQEA